ncbi:hypothetical protein KQH49_08020 [Mycetohabitans sp. B5]|jgi:hypothetical protein|uniref:Uncharacterized protein n=1 Tax=Mycetohabitans endofungorum TaxID=417203 RepID=A0A2P5KAT0_9BURK|nr:MULTISPECIES: hypothetical protein [Burkholderiaceae]MCF2135427.1 hypothetical protein [Mycetohabitans sp. B3]MCG1019667.1 hypothetical protein [Mycetohabitans sp. B4]MCG1040663.1 hypothetical protein [Mycetohabitans sp. B7]MCG1054900.1 hypothetical protein [Mycetohabitans sp. B5]PPB83801.1 hypothetical protein B0O95_106192 [Mycetohabitans endofungorum]
MQFIIFNLPADLSEEALRDRLAPIGARLVEIIRDNVERARAIIEVAHMAMASRALALNFD